MQPMATDVPKWMLQVLNNVCEIERKIGSNAELASLRRNLDRIKDAFESTKLFYQDPMGEVFDETRSDVEASISGTGTENLVVVEVIKPIIRLGDAAFSRVVQRGIVIVQTNSD